MSPGSHLGCSLPIARRSCSPMPKPVLSAPRMAAGAARLPVSWRRRSTRWWGSAPAPNGSGPASGPVHFLCDLSGYIALRLQRLGLAAVERALHDTAAEEELFFSYRRACL